MSAANEPGSLPSMFRLRFEYLDEGGAIIRSDHMFNAADLLGLKSPDKLVAQKATELRVKVVNAMQADGYVPPPSNVINVDFKRGKRA